MCRRSFQVLADEVLRRRFLDLAEDSSKQLVVRPHNCAVEPVRGGLTCLGTQLESCAPYERPADQRQPLSFSQFAPSPAGNAFTGNVALFAVDTASGEADALRLALEDGDMFQQSILSVHLRAAPATAKAPPAPAAPAHDDMETDAEDEDPVSARRFIDYSWTLDVASSLDRFQRAWFLESASEASSSSPTPTLSSSPSLSYTSSLASSRESSPSPSHSPSTCATPRRVTRTRLLGPSRAHKPSPARSALLSAAISCVQVPLEDVPPEGDEADVLWALASRGGSGGGGGRGGSPAGAGSRYGSPMSTAPRTYEYYVDEVALDVGKVLVLAEEALPGCAREVAPVAGGTRSSGPTVMRL